MSASQRRETKNAAMVPSPKMTKKVDTVKACGREKLSEHRERSEHTAQSLRKSEEYARNGVERRLVKKSFVDKYDETTNHKVNDDVQGNDAKWCKVYDGENRKQAPDKASGKTRGTC